MRPRKITLVKKQELVTSTHELASQTDNFETISKDGRRYGVRRREEV